MRFHDGSRSKWRDVDGLGSAEEDCAEEERLLKVQAAAPSHGLLRVQGTERTSLVASVPPRISRRMGPKVCSWWITLRLCCLARLSYS